VAVVHQASPVGVEDPADPQGFIVPAFKGTTGVLGTFARYAPSVKAIAQISSTVAVDHGSKAVTCTESSEL
jgi:nucleoside-diphosphate-sugar epimerase